MRRLRCWLAYLRRPEWDTRRHNWLRIWPLIDVPHPTGCYTWIYECQRCGVRQESTTLVMDSVDEQIEMAVYNGHWNMPSV